MFETRGRKSIEAYVDGGFYKIKKPYHLSENTTAVLLPKDWIDTLETIKGKPIKYFLLDVKDTLITIKPYFDDIPEVA
jgi:hypothetical protein